MKIFHSDVDGVVGRQLSNDVGIKSVNCGLAGIRRTKNGLTDAIGRDECLLRVPIFPVESF